METPKAEIIVKGVTCPYGILDHLGVEKRIVGDECVGCANFYASVSPDSVSCWYRVREGKSKPSNWVNPLRDNKQSLRPYRMDLIDPKALLKLAGVMHDGLETHEPDGWREGIPIEEHIGHAMTHMVAWMAGNRDIDHLPRAFARIMMAVALEEKDNAI